MSAHPRMDADVVIQNMVTLVLQSADVLGGKESDFWVALGFTPDG